MLPVLPALLSASGTGGRRRPLGIVAGLTLTHTITIVGVASVVDGVGFADGTLRTLAIAVLALFGVALLVPRATGWIEQRLSLFSRLAPRSGGEGFWPGLPVGGALGFVYAPCAGPILTAVISVSASQGTTGELVAVGVAYGLGSAATLLGLAIGGRRVIGRLRPGRRGPLLQRAFAVVMVLTAVLMFSKLDLRFQTALAADLPSFLRNPTRELERSAAVEDRLARVRGRSLFDSRATPARRARPSGEGRADVRRPELAVLGSAPEFGNTQRWFNSPALTIAGLRGRVVLVDFWTYTCINCVATLPYLRAWDDRYRRAGLTIVGVHTPEFAFEKSASNVQDAIRERGLRYPVVQDNEFATWNAFGNQFWPAKYLIDAAGRVRYTHFGEGDYDQTEAAIRALLAEAGRRDLGATARTRGELLTPARDATAETYLGAARARSFSPVSPRRGTHDYVLAGAASLPRSVFSLGGRWTIDDEAARAVRFATLRARLVAKGVFLVLASKDGRPRRVHVSLDGRPIGAVEAGRDVHDGAVTVRRQRLYHLVRLPRSEEHVLTLRLDRDVSGYAFTFR